MDASEATDPLGQAYPDWLTGQYDCVDRIILNGYFQLGCSPGGFRVWWRKLHGSDDTLDNAHLMRMAGRFSRCLRGWAKKNSIPVIDCSIEAPMDLQNNHLVAQAVSLCQMDGKSGVCAMQCNET